MPLSLEIDCETKCLMKNIYIVVKDRLAKNIFVTDTYTLITMSDETPFTLFKQ